MGDKSKLLIASMLSTGSDSDRCFATFYFYQGNSTAPIKPRFSHQKTAFFTSENGVLQSENGVLQSENGVFLTIKCKGKRVFPHHLYSYTFALCFSLSDG